MDAPHFCAARRHKDLYGYFVWFVTDITNQPNNNREFWHKDRLLWRNPFLKVHTSSVDSHDGILIADLLPDIVTEMTECRSGNRHV